MGLSFFATATYAFNALIALLGLRLLWTQCLSPSARAAQKPAALTPWASAGGVQIVLLCWLALVGGFLVQLAFVHLLPGLNDNPDMREIVAGSGFQLGMLLGVSGFMFYTDAGRDYSLPHRPLIKAGIATFAISLALVLAVGLLWHKILELSGYPPEKQDLVALFEKHNSPVMLSLMITLATLVAPITEELLFRAGLFRFMRTRSPRWVALLVPAILFGALHMNLASFPQLVVLALVFSVAYERTGNIGVPILAHCLFNLNSILCIIAGVDA
jgi:membrane protease YdiL (CAAX protease family)